MPGAFKSGIEIRVTPPPSGAAGPSPPSAQTRKALNHYSLLLAPGVLVGLVAYVVFPLLDAGPLVVLGFCTLFLPLVMHFRSMLKKNLSDDLPRLHKIYVYASLALLLIGFLPLLNGWLDRSPARTMRATVLQKTSSTRRSSTSYRLVVSSWRPGRKVEELVVGSRTYNNVSVGATITVEVHPGYFGLPWSGAVWSK